MSDVEFSRQVLNGEDIDLSHAPTYAKIGKIRAVCMQDPFVVVTLEGIMHAEEGDYLCEAILSDGSPGERWAVKKERFSATYRLNDIQARPAPCEPGEFGADRKPLLLPTALLEDTLPVDDVLVAADDEVAV